MIIHWFWDGVWVDDMIRYGMRRQVRMGWDGMRCDGTGYRLYDLGSSMKVDESRDEMR